MEAYPRGEFIKVNRIVLFSLFLFIPMMNASAGVDDVIKGFVKYHGLHREDEVIQMKFDWNEDGYDDLFLSSTLSDDDNARAGLFWNVYLSRPDGTYPEQPNDLISVPVGVRIKRMSQLSNRLALIYVHRGGADQGVIVAYWVDEKNNIKQQDFANIRLDVEAPEADKKVANEYFSGSKAVKADRKPLSAFFSQNELDTIRSRNDDP